MDLAIIMQIVAVFASIFSLLYVVRTTLKLNRSLKKYEPVIDRIGNLVSIFQFGKDEESGEVLIDERLGTLIQSVSSAMAKTMKMSILGAMSGPARLEKGLKGAIATDIIENKMPLLNLIGDFLGFNTKKYIAKHPDAIGQLMQLAGPYLPQILGQPNNGNPGPAAQPQISKIEYGKM